MPKLKITETVLRDGQEFLAGARITTSEIATILPTLDKVGYHSVDVFGGSSFDVCLRYLNEDPWERLRIISSNMPHTKRQMTVRGQSLVGYRNYPDDIVKYFIQKAVSDGIDIVRVYDPLNDIRNLETAITAAKDEGKSVQGTLTYTASPVHSTEAFLDYAEQLVSLGVDSICIRDEAGLLRPYEAYQLVKALRTNYKALPLQLHTHETTGMAAMTILKTVEVGVDVVDTALSPFACGNSLSSTESIAAAFMNTPYVPEIDAHALAQASEYFSDLRTRFLDAGTIDRNFLKVDPDVLRHQIPTGLYSRMLGEVCRHNGSDVYKKVLDEIPFVRSDAGYPPLVTPIVEILGTQALYNVLNGERYKTVTSEFEDLIAGKYGRTPAPISAEFQKTILGERIPISHRPADTLDPMVEFYRTKVSPYAEQEEDLLTMALFEDVAIKFFEWRKNQRYKLDSRASHRSATHPI